MRTIKFIIAYIIAALAFILVIAEIDVNVFAFFAIKLACIAIIAVCIKAIVSTGIIELEDD